MPGKWFAFRVDPISGNGKNITMADTTSIPAPDVLPFDDATDTRAVFELLATGKPVDPEILARIRRDAERIRNEIFERHGVLDIGTPAIRELRDR
jgi:hypothetical protein